MNHIKQYLIVFFAALLLAGCSDPFAKSGASDDVNVSGEGNTVTVIDTDVRANDSGEALVDQLNPDNSDNSTEEVSDGESES